MKRRGLILSDRALGQSWEYFTVTAEGEEIAGRMQRDLNPRATKYLDDVRTWVVSQPFTRLLRSIYKKYPDYAINSIFAK